MVMVFAGACATPRPRARKAPSRIDRRTIELVGFMVCFSGFTGLVWSPNQHEAASRRETRQREIHATLLRQAKTRSALQPAGRLALAAFIKRPQADVQIGAGGIPGDKMPSGQSQKKAGPKSRSRRPASLSEEYPGREREDRQQDRRRPAHVG